MSETPPPNTQGRHAVPAAQSRPTLLESPECVHCGFCLPVCPTYDALGTEMDSPRGRLHLMRALEEGRVRPTAEAVRHLDLCLGCRACEAECPSGVPFGSRLEETRARLRQATGRGEGASTRPFGQRFIEAAMLRAVAAPYGLQRTGAGALRLAGSLGLTGLAASAASRGVLPGRAGAAVRLLGEARLEPVKIPYRTPARGERRMTVGLLLGCVAQWMFGHINAATVRVLSAAGCEVIVPRGQGCCGALHAHAGDVAGARSLAARMIGSFGSIEVGEAGETVEASRSGGSSKSSESGRLGERSQPPRLDAIVVNAAGCGSVMKEYEHLFGRDGSDSTRAAAFSAKVCDVLELLAEIGLPEPLSEVPARVAYHDACHLAHAQGVTGAPRALLSSVPGVTLVPLTDADRCCGSAGIYNLLHPEVASKILASKLERLRASEADTVAAANPGCLMQISAGLSQMDRADTKLMRPRAVHPIEILDRACSAGQRGAP